MRDRKDSTEKSVDVVEKKDIPKSILNKNNKILYEDYYFVNQSKGFLLLDMLSFEREEQMRFKNSIFLRVNSSKKITFRNFNFSHSFFEDCVIRAVVFDNCNFTDCKFQNCDFKGTTFENCDFRYAKFQSTFIHENIFQSSAPREHNLRRNLARSLRENFRDLGLKQEEYVATKIELQAQGSFLKEAWSSTDSYYSKYSTLERIYKLGEWLVFKFNHLIWGHGEKMRSLVYSFSVMLLFIAIVISLQNSKHSFFENLAYVLQYFIGSIDKPHHFGEIVAMLITLFRLVFSGLLLAIIIKKMSR